MPRMKQRAISAPVNIVLPVPVWPSTIALWLAWANRSRTIGAPVVRASMLNTGERVDAMESANGVTLTLPAAAPAEWDRVVVVETRRQ